MVLSGFLVLTVFVEMPIVIACLRRHTKDRIKLAVTVLVVNIATTITVAGLERLILKGQW